MDGWRWYHKIRLRLRALFRRSHMERELDEEFRFHLDQRMEYEIGRGLPPAEARRIAIRAMEGIEQKKEECRDMRHTQLIEQSLRDLRYGCRSLRKSPVFTVVAILSLALGIGANTAIFTLVDQIVLRLLPVKNPRELVQLRLEGGRFGTQSGDGRHTFSRPAYLALRDGNSVFSGLTGQVFHTASLAGNHDSELINIGLVAGNFFQVFGIEPHLGRLITPEDDKVRNGYPVVVLQYNFWKNRFAGNRNLVGGTIRLNGAPFTVIGVSAPGFEGTNPGMPTPMWAPVTMRPTIDETRDDLDDERSAWFYLVGRLKPDVTVEQAQAALRVLYRQRQHEELQGAFFQKHPEDRAPFLRQNLSLIPASGGQSALRSRFGAPLILLQGLVGLVLLIACTNVASLLLARATARQREVAIRGALGASRGQLVRQFLIESVMLAVGGGAAGVLLSSWMTRGLLYILPYDPANLSLSMTPDSRVLLFSAGITLLTALLFGLAPALRGSRVSPGFALKQEAGGIAGGHVTLRKAFVAVQIGLSCLLLTGAGLFARTLQNLKNVDLGFDTENVVTFSVRPAVRYDTAHKLQLFRSLIEGLASVPQIKAVGANREKLLTGGTSDSNINIAGVRTKDGNPPWSLFNAVTPGYFDALGIPIIAGRDLKWSDWGGSRQLSLVNQALVDEYLDSANAVGRFLAQGRNKTPDREIIGVIANTRYEDVRGSIPRQVFVSLDSKLPYTDSVNVYARVQGDPRPVMPMLRDQAHNIDSNLVISDMRTLNDQLNTRLSNERLLSFLSTGFAVLASLLAVVGLYGVVAFVVARRTREIGIRMALGADKRRVARLVLGEMLTVVLVGITGGLLCGLLFGRFVQSQLFGVGAADPSVLFISAASLFAASLVAALAPAWRASRITPMAALRHD